MSAFVSDSKGSWRREPRLTGRSRLFGTGNGKQLSDLTWCCKAICQSTGHNKGATTGWIYFPVKDDMTGTTDSSLIVCLNKLTVREDQKEQDPDPEQRSCADNRRPLNFINPPSYLKSSGYYTPQTPTPTHPPHPHPPPDMEKDL